MPTDAQIEAALAAWHATRGSHNTVWLRIKKVLKAAERAAWCDDMSLAPRHGGEVDLWCEDGAGNSRRCPSCTWEPMTDWMGNEYEGWFGVRDGYKPIAWRLPPEGPK